MTNTEEAIARVRKSVKPTKAEGPVTLLVTCSPAIEDVETLLDEYDAVSHDLERQHDLNTELVNENDRQAKAIKQLRDAIEDYTSRYSQDMATGSSFGRLIEVLSETAEFEEGE